MRMKTAIFALVSAMLLVGCIGTTARQQALLPAMRLAWQTSIAESVTLGGGDPAPMTKALESGDVQRVISLPWGKLRDQALAGIQKLLDDGEIGLNAMTIMHNELALFDRALRVLAGLQKSVARRAYIKIGKHYAYNDLGRYHDAR